MLYIRSRKLPSGPTCWDLFDIFLFCFKSGMEWEAAYPNNNYFRLWGIYAVSAMYYSLFLCFLYCFCTTLKMYIKTFLACRPWTIVCWSLTWSFVMPTIFTIHIKGQQYQIAKPHPLYWGARKIEWIVSILSLYMCYFLKSIPMKR